MARVIAHPFRLDTAGNVAAVEDGSDDANDQAVAVLISTRQGERPLVPAFGVPDPVFGELAAADVAAGLAAFGPDLTVVEVAATPSSDTVEDVVVSYRDDSTDDYDPDPDELDEE